MGLGTVFNAVVNRRDPASGLTPPILKSLAIGLIPVSLIFLATQLPTLQRGLLTTALTPLEWFICAGLAALLPLIVELTKLTRRRHAPAPVQVGAEYVVAPSRALTKTAG
jgi:P-type Ca2+ transporter type 2C